MIAVARLEYLLTKDTKARWVIIVSAILAMAFTGFIADMSGLSLGYAEGLALLVGVLVLFGRIAMFCAPPGKGIIADKSLIDVKHRTEKAHS